MRGRFFLIGKKIGFLTPSEAGSKFGDFFFLHTARFLLEKIFSLLENSFFLLQNFVSFQKCIF